MGEYGSTLHQLHLIDGQRRGFLLSSILSEGEQRICGLASFLVDVRTAPGVAGIIFDDPVSSLDHRYREYVAERLVAEGRNRQVIIFTHDIVFLQAIEEHAAKQQVHLLTQTVLRTSKQVGICDPEIPWISMILNKRIGYLKKRLQSARAIFKAGDEQQYSLEAASIYSLLRESWEKAVEEVLFGDTVKRMRQAIETQKLKDVIFDDTDYVKVHWAVKRCSMLMQGHDEPAASNRGIVGPEEIEKDLTELEKFVVEARTRHQKVEAHRKSLIKPPDPVM